MNHDKDADTYTKGAYALMDSPFGKRIDENEFAERSETQLKEAHQVNHKLTAEIKNLKRLLRWCRDRMKMSAPRNNDISFWAELFHEWHQPEEIDAILTEHCPYCGQEVKE